MKGRPTRSHDRALYDAVVAACRQADLSISAFAKWMGCSPSTLTRSMNEQAFSKALAARIRRHLQTGIPPQGSRSETPDNTSLHELLHILHKLSEIAPQASRTVERMLDRNRPMD